MTPLTPLELACGVVLPPPRRPPRLPAPPRGITPRGAFERALLAGLRRSHCLVSFSGGRDSSAVLAAATAVATREGLPPPIPVTHRFSGAAGAEEAAWQEQVIAHLGLPEWVRIEARAELDCVGPVAAEVLRRHGVLWPCNTYFHAPIFAAARGGAVLTGIGGDEAFSESSWARAVAVLSGRARPVPRDALRVGLALAPVAVKRRHIRGRLPALWHWLRPAARRAVADAVAADAAREPLRRRSRYRHVVGSPAMAAGLASLAAIAREHDADVLHPLRDELLLATLAALPRGRRPASRTEAMRELAGDLLPPALITRSTKAHFGEVLWGEGSRAVAAGWSGDGVDHELVDADRLAAEWRSPQPDTHTITLLQSVWLSRARAGAPPPGAARTSLAAA